MAAAILFLIGAWSRNGKVNAQWLLEDGVTALEPAPSYVAIETEADGAHRYVVNGEPQLFIGMGYNPIYRYLRDGERGRLYERDFKMLCEGGVNHITGWDADKGYDQDKFDELTLDTALRYGIGVVMPLNLPPEGDYTDAAFVDRLMEEGRAKLDRFRRHPGLRMWGIGNEVLTEMPRPMYPAFARAYLRIIDMFHDLDPNHPVIYREAEDVFVPGIKRFIERRGERPWFFYGINIYSMELEGILDRWPDHDFGRPLFVSEFGAEPLWPGGRAINYVNMWRMIRAHPAYVLGGAPYVWSVEGPEPTDRKWGLVDGQARPVDETFEQLAQEWRREPDNAGRACNGQG